MDASKGCDENKGKTRFVPSWKDDPPGSHMTAVCGVLPAPVEATRSRGGCRVCSVISHRRIPAPTCGSVMGAGTDLNFIT